MINAINIVTNNVARELLRIAAQNSTSISQLYIKINSITTFVKDNNSDFLEIFNEDFNKYTDEISMRNDTVEFEQEYYIEIKSQPESYPFKNMISEIEFDEKATLAYLVIKKGSKLEYYNELYNDFLSYITEQKLRSNILVYLFDVDYTKSIKQFVDVIEKIKNLTFNEDKKILISKGLNEIKSVNAEISMNIEDNYNIGVEDNEGKVDYSNRGFLLGCAEGEQLFEFSKPKQGKHGRNCKGKIIEIETVNLDTKPIFTVEDNIEIQDSFENIKYLSCRNGYLVKKGNTYDVLNCINLDEISFKTTGTINTDLNSEISINVVKNNPLEDAIEKGMNVKVQNLSIDGSIGPNTKIETRNISITGQSHSDSFIQCINADIGLHKGKIVGRRVEVKTLEGGEIIADIAIIQNAMGGKITAKTIEIKMLGSHVTMEASEYIQVESIRGEENKFIFDSFVGSGLDRDKEDDEACLKKSENELKSLIKTYKEASVKVKNSLEICEKIKAAIIKTKNQGVEISSTLIQKFKLCKVMQVHYKKLKEDIVYKKSQYEKLEKKLFSNGSDIFDAKIVLNESLKGYNHILYKLNDTQTEIELHTNESMNKKIFKLIEDEDGVVKIMNC